MENNNLRLEKKHNPNPHQFIDLCEKRIWSYSKHAVVGWIDDVTGPLWWKIKSSVDSPHNGQRFDVFFDLRLKKNGWANNRVTGDLRRHRAHYDVTAMIIK